MAFDRRAYVGGNFALEIDGLSTGWLLSAEGGMPSADVILESTGPSHLQHKHIAGLKFDDITLSFGSGMSKVFWERLKDSFERRRYSRISGAVVAADYKFREKWRLEFSDALVGELTFPGLDASSKEPCKCVLKLLPERAKMSGGDGRDDEGDDYVIRDAKDQAKQHRWSPSNFRLNIDGLDASRVYKIEPITLRQKTVDFAIGEERGIQKEPVQVEYPNLRVTIPESHSRSWWSWYQSFVVDGKNSEPDEKTGTLEYLSPSLGNTTLLALDLFGLGIYKATPDRAEAGSEAIRRVTFELYCERIGFDYRRGSTFGGGR
jgi:hypothetical protein